MKSLFYSLILVVAITHVAIAQKAPSKDKSFPRVIVIEKDADVTAETLAVEPSEVQGRAIKADVLVKVIAHPSKGEEVIHIVNNTDALDAIDPETIESVDVLRNDETKQITVHLKHGVAMPILETGKVQDLTRKAKMVVVEEDTEMTISTTDISEVVHLTVTTSEGGETHTYQVVTDARPCHSSAKSPKAGNCMVVSPCCLLQDPQDASEKPYLGVVLHERDGILEITEVRENSPALSAGFMVGDILDKVSQSEITTLGTLTKAMAQVSVNDKIKVRVIRSGKKHKLTVNVGAMPVEKLPCCAGSCCQAKAKLNSTDELKKVIVIQPIKEDVEEPEPIKMVLTDEMIQLTTYPNPATDQLTVDFMSPSVDRLQVRLLDAAGKTAVEVIENSFEGAFSESLSVKNLNPGIYYLRLDIDDQTITKQIVIDGGK